LVRRGRAALASVIERCCSKGLEQAMSEPTQDHRPGVLTTPLGKDALLLVNCYVEEGLSELFQIRIDALSKQSDINFDPAIGQPCSVKIRSYQDEVREFNGILVEAQWSGVQDDLFSYRLILRPWLWLLTQTSDCRIFENKKVPDIIEEVFRDRGFTVFESQIKDMEAFPKLEYCVQYRETDFDFVSRLMEKEGIYYFFKHDSGKHTLVLANMKSSHLPVPNHATIQFNPNQNYVTKEQHISHWISARRFRTGKIELNDYNYEKSKVRMLSQAKGSESYAHSDMEVYDYPGNYKDTKAGDRYAKIELEAVQAEDHRRQGSGDAVSLFPGGLTKLKGHPVSAQNTEYLIVRAVHSFGDQTYESTAGNVPVSYRVDFEFLPTDHQFRAPIITPKPRIHGIQTAVVVDKQAKGHTEKSSLEIEVEPLTEVYVHFYWDRRKHDEKRSCKIRVAQVWSGKNWGGQFIPRIGQEAVIEFLDGDPDRPLVVGTVYNDEYMPPYKLPDNKTVSGIKSDSTIGGKGYNEWSFDDQKGSEKITVHAQNDLDTTVLHAETRTVGSSFKPPAGSPSRKTALKNGDDQLDVENGAILYTAKEKIVFTVGPSKITMDNKSITIESPTITIRATTTCVIQGLPVKIN
jgi:type VI secretion system secreted protein VgrG